MGKYDPLHRHLVRRGGDALEFDFAQLERLLGAFLPNAAHSQAWWTNDPKADPKMVQRHAWLEAGYEASLVGAERVRFQRINAAGAARRREA